MAASPRRSFSVCLKCPRFGLRTSLRITYVIADNRLAEKAGWDTSILAIELQNLTTIGGELDVTITGFDIPEIACS
jgi:hypothetical protein